MVFCTSVVFGMECIPLINPHIEYFLGFETKKAKTLQNHFYFIQVTRKGLSKPPDWSLHCHCSWFCGLQLKVIFWGIELIRTCLQDLSTLQHYKINWRKLFSTRKNVSPWQLTNLLLQISVKIWFHQYNLQTCLQYYLHFELVSRSNAWAARFVSVENPLSEKVQISEWMTTKELTSWISCRQPTAYKKRCWSWSTKYVTYLHSALFGIFEISTLQMKLTQWMVRQEIQLTEPELVILGLLFSIFKLHPKQIKTWLIHMSSHYGKPAKWPDERIRGRRSEHQ